MIKYQAPNMLCAKKKKKKIIKKQKPRLLQLFLRFHPQFFVIQLTIDTIAEEPNRP